jgi:hypothetical protein
MPIKSDMPNEDEIFALAKSTGAASAVQSIKETDLFGQEKPDEKYIEINEFSQTQLIRERARTASVLLQKEGTPFSAAALKEILFYSSLVNVPEQFIGKKTDNKELVEFSIYLTSATAEQIITEMQTREILKKQTNKEVKKQNSKKTKQQNNKVKKEDDKKEGVSNSSKAENTDISKDGQAKKDIKKDLDFSILNNIIKDSKLTFFYPYNFKILNDVPVGILSITPYEENQHIIKFEIKNNTQNFFIVANISVKILGNRF